MAHQIRQGAYGLGRRILDLNIMITKKYTNKRYYEEINGIGKGSGIHAKEFARINLVPELIKAACTVAGVWGKASQNGKTLHVRALDWDYKNPISKLPIVTIYHPSNPNWQTHANFAWVGFVGSMTGMSTKVTLG
jgi:isopenicillin-N N-acyltransferase-like protein